MKIEPKANVTNILTINNNLAYNVSLISGESNQRINIAAKSIWQGTVWVPWIGNQDETFKAIRCFTGAHVELVAYIFQDYWNPPHKDAIKFSREKILDYNANNPFIPGNSFYGGNKKLTLSQYSPDGVLIFQLD